MSSKPKKNGFFDVPENDETVFEENVGPEMSEKAVKGKKSPALKIVILSLVAVICVWCGVKYLSKSEDVKESVYYPSSWTETEYRKPALKYYEPDYETDIKDVPEYMELNRIITYSPDGMQHIGLLPEDYYEIGGNGLVFMTKYIEALIAGDNEALNLMFNEEYYEENEPIGKITQQKLFDIRITKYEYHAEKYKDTAYDDLYYIVSYSIYHNDATFRDDIDEECVLPQLFELLVYPDKSIKIKRVTNVPGCTY